MNFRKKIEIKDTDGNVIFSLKKKNNTIKETVEEAVTRGISLANADLETANLCNAKLDFANLVGANLKGANLIKSSLVSANLDNALLTDANLNYADLSKASIRCAYLDKASMFCARLNESNLSHANLFWANMCCSSLVSAILFDTCLQNANLEKSSFSCSDLERANLKNSNLTSVDFSHSSLKDTLLDNAKLIGTNFHDAFIPSDFGSAIIDGADLSCVKTNTMPHVPLACPSDGEFVGWKKVRSNNKYYLVKLLIPKDAKRSSATSAKCRCNKAKVLSITNTITGKKFNIVENHKFGQIVKYKVGEFVYPDKFDENRFIECSNGIYFFINKQDALDY